MLRIAVVDDDIEITELVKTMIQSRTVKLCGRKKAEITTYTKPELLVYELNENKYFDIFVLDIEMAGMDGLQLAEYIRKTQEEGYIIFLTCHPEFAIKGYDRRIRAYQYILKEKMNDLLPLVIDEVVRKCLKEEERYFFIANQQYLEKFRCEKIIYIKKDEKNCVIVTDHGKRVNRITLEKAKQRLDMSMFAAVDRGCIVNMRHVEKIEGNEVWMDNGDVLGISRKSTSRVKKEVREYWEKIYEKGDEEDEKQDD